jgi:hypothetical protein
MLQNKASYSGPSLRAPPDLDVLMVVSRTTTSKLGHSGIPRTSAIHRARTPATHHGHAGNVLINQDFHPSEAGDLNRTDLLDG